MGEAEARQSLDMPLKYPGLAIRPRAHQSLRMWRQPAFDPEVSWTLLQDGDDWYVRRIVYAPRLHTGQIIHDTFGAEARIARRAAMSILQDLQTISLRPFVSRSLGLDGVIRGIVVAQPFGETRVSWWGPAPCDWAQLRDWFGKTVQDFEDCLMPCSIPLQVRHPWVE